MAAKLRRADLSFANEAEVKEFDKPCAAFHHYAEKGTGDDLRILQRK